MSLFASSISLFFYIFLFRSAHNIQMIVLNLFVSKNYLHRRLCLVSKERKQWSGSYSLHLFHLCFLSSTSFLLHRSFISPTSSSPPPSHILLRSSILSLSPFEHFIHNFFLSFTLHNFSLQISSLSRS